MTLIRYKGKITYENIGHLVNKMDMLIKTGAYPLPVYKKVLSAMVELLENIHKHHACTECNLSKTFPDVFELKRIDDTITLSGSNLMQKDELACTVKHIDRIKAYTREQAKRVYKEIIGNGKFSSKGGAGLGFLEIRKVSNNDFEYKIKSVNNNYAYFTLLINIGTQKSMINKQVTQ